MLPLSDGIPARRFPIVNVFLIVANFAVWIFYELPQQPAKPDARGEMCIGVGSGIVNLVMVYQQ
jgi:hypothetical protein